LIDALEHYGPVEDVSIFHDPRPTRNKRYAFAKFAYRDDAIKAYVVSCTLFFMLLKIRKQRPSSLQTSIASNH